MKLRALSKRHSEPDIDTLIVLGELRMVLCICRIIDGSRWYRAYGNEKEVGEGLKASGVPREEVYVCNIPNSFTQLFALCKR